MSILNKKAFQQLIDEDIVWLLQQPRSLERDHIKTLLEWSVLAWYPGIEYVKGKCSMCRGTGMEFPGNPSTEKCEDCDGTGFRDNRVPRITNQPCRNCGGSGSPT